MTPTDSNNSIPKNINSEKAQEIEDLCRKCINELNTAERMIDQITTFQKKGSSDEGHGPERTWENKVKAEKLNRLNNIKGLLNDAITKIGILLKQILQLSKGLSFDKTQKQDMDIDMGKNASIGMGIMGSSSAENDKEEN